jgi:transcriptional regulator
MYIRAVHAEADLAVLRALIRDNPLGMLTTAIRSPTYPFLQTSHIPFVLDDDNGTGNKTQGRLRGHLARQNPHSKAMIETLTNKPTEGNMLEEEVLVIFNAPAHHYITPKFYTKTKPETGKVVPTWNYAAAQVYGKAKIYFDSKSEETSSFLGQQIRDLSHHNETHVMGYTGEAGRPSEWKVSDAPERYIDLLQKAIVGIEITIDRLEGKFKMSQEMGEEDRQGVADGLGNLSTDAAQWVSKTVQARGAERDT